MGAPTIAALATQFAAAAGGPDGPEPLAPLEVTGARHVLASVFDVTGFAAATVGAAGAALAELDARLVPAGPPPRCGSTRGPWPSPS